MTNEMKVAELQDENELDESVPNPPLPNRSTHLTSPPCFFFKSPDCVLENTTQLTQPSCGIMRVFDPRPL